MDIFVVEAFWRDPSAKEEYGSRFTVKPYWTAFGDHWCWENGAAPLRVTVATAHGKASLAGHLDEFKRLPGPGVLVVGAHGGDWYGKMRLLLPDRKGQPERASWAEVTDRLAGSTDTMANKLVLFDSCSFLSEWESARTLLHRTGAWMVAGFKKDVEPLDSMFLELAFVNYLLSMWRHERKAAFKPDFHEDDESPISEEFGARYRALARATGFVAYRRVGAGKVVRDYPS